MEKKMNKKVLISIIAVAVVFVAIISVVLVNNTSIKAKKDVTVEFGEEPSTDPSTYVTGKDLSKATVDTSKLITTRYGSTQYVTVTLGNKTVKVEVEVVDTTKPKLATTSDITIVKTNYDVSPESVVTIEEKNGYNVESEDLNDYGNLYYTEVGLHETTLDVTDAAGNKESITFTVLAAVDPYIYDDGTYICDAATEDASYYLAKYFREQDKYINPTTGTCLIGGNGEYVASNDETNKNDSTGTSNSGTTSGNGGSAGGSGGSSSGGNSGSSSGTSSSGGSSSASTSSSGYFDRAMADQLWSLIAAERKRMGADQLTKASYMQAIADQRAKEIVTDWSHNKAQTGENLAKQATNAQEFFNAWKASSGHYKNMIGNNNSVSAISVYCKDGIYYAVQVFEGDTVVASITETRYEDDGTVKSIGVGSGTDIKTINYLYEVHYIYYNSHGNSIGRTMLYILEDGTTYPSYDEAHGKMYKIGDIL